MDTQWKKFSALYLFFLLVQAQDIANKRDVDPDPLHPSMAVMLTVLSIMFCVIFLIVAFAKFCHRSELYLANVQGRWSPDAIVTSGSRFSGIDRAVIESLPFFRFSLLKGSKDGLECAVCLSRFEDIEILRLLPKCRHAFHISCIDKWLENHSSCPLCRHRLDPRDFGSCLTCTNNFGNLYIQREESRERSLRFDRKVLHSLRHRIFVSDVIMYRSRWSDVSSSDLTFLNSQMLEFDSRQRFSDEERVLKIKEDMDQVGTSGCSNSNTQRSMSEITNISRFKETEKDNDEVRRHWLPIVRTTIQRFSGPEAGNNVAIHV